MAPEDAVPTAASMLTLVPPVTYTPAPAAQPPVEAAAIEVVGAAETLTETAPVEPEALTESDAVTVCETPPDKVTAVPVTVVAAVAADATPADVAAEIVAVVTPVGTVKVEAATAAAAT